MDSTDDRCRPISPLAGSKWATNADSAPSRIMLGGAVLKSGQCNPPAIICLRRRSKVQRPGASRRPYSSIWRLCSCLAARCSPGSAALPTTLPATAGSRRAGGRRRSRGMNPTSSAQIVAGRQQLHCFLAGTEHLTPHASRFGSLSESRGAADRSFTPAGRRARMPAAFYVGPCSEARAEALRGKYSDAMVWHCEE